MRLARGDGAVQAGRVRGSRGCAGSDRAVSSPRRVEPACQALQVPIGPRSSWLSYEAWSRPLSPAPMSRASSSRLDPCPAEIRRTFGHARRCRQAAVRSQPCHLRLRCRFNRCLASGSYRSVTSFPAPGAWRDPALRAELLLDLLWCALRKMSCSAARIASRDRICRRGRPAAGTSWTCNCLDSCGCLLSGLGDGPPGGVHTDRRRRSLPIVLIDASCHDEKRG